jgi:Tissue inhibitor of metalloproteinase
MLIIRLLFTVGLALTTLTFGSTALACKCAPHSVAEGLNDAAAVFEGRVVSIEDVSEGTDPAVAKKRVTLSIVRVWKDLEDIETVTLTTNAESAACGFQFERDKSYLVYANRSEQSLTVHSCTRTRLIADAGEDLSQLGAGVTPVRIIPAAPAGEPSKAAAPATTKPPKRGGCAVSREGKSGLAACALSALALGLIRRRFRRS